MPSNCLFLKGARKALPSVVFIRACLSKLSAKAFVDKLALLGCQRKALPSGFQTDVDWLTLLKERKQRNRKDNEEREAHCFNHLNHFSLYLFFLLVLPYFKMYVQLSMCERDIATV